MSDDVLVKVQGVSKKFCRTLKRSLWYGVQDVAGEMLGRQGGNYGLRPGEFWAVNDVSFELKRGECLGLIGHNGAGKTTLLRMLNGLIKPDHGRIEMRGRVSALIALGAGFNPVLTGRENIYVNASVLGLRKWEIDEKIDEIIDFAELDEFIDSPVQSYSSGMHVRLGFAIASSLQPDILLLDEVLAVGDAAFRVKCFNRLQEMMNRCAVIFVSHNMPQVTRICDHLLLMRKGEASDFGKDIGNIISHYHKSIKVCNDPIFEGSGKAIINSVEFRDRDNQKCETFQQNLPYSIFIDFQLSNLIREEAIKVLITISDQEDVNVAQIYEDISVSNGQDTFMLNLYFNNMLLNAGRYWLTVNILLGERGEFLCVLRRAASITVENSYVGYAPILLSCNRIENAKEKSSR